jgi:diketogulonate reductase-like aldo/keto reductase
LNQIAGRMGRTTAQVLLRWCLQHELDALDYTNGTDRALEHRWW